MIDLGTATRLIAGAVGEPGDRTFYLEVHSDSGVTWFVVEKVQVAALAVQINELIGIEDDDEGEASGLTTDPLPTFRVAEIRVGAAGDDFRIMLEPTESSGSETVTFLIGRAALAAMAGPALQVVRAGRPVCPRCGLAMDPEGHACPTGNGDLRHHRP